jgi:hypothetical protein
MTKPFRDTLVAPLTPYTPNVVLYPIVVLYALFLLPASMFFNGGTYQWWKTLKEVFRDIKGMETVLEYHARISQ